VCILLTQCRQRIRQLHIASYALKLVHICSCQVCRGSQRLRGFDRLRASYGQSTVGRDGASSGWLTNDGSTLSELVSGSKYSVDWRTADMQAGDVVIIDSHVLHMSATNVSGQIRLSCDTRWQPAGDFRDPRLKVWHSASAAAH
jgi:hypothetical protein